MVLPELGVGLVYQSGLDVFVRSHRELVDVVEVEPQTLSYPRLDEPERWTMDEASLARITRLSCAKIVHGVGFPVGGSRPAFGKYLGTLREVVSRLGASWASEHLAFNRARAAGRDFETALLLPPRQTEEGALLAAKGSREVAESLPVPFAIETGVSYLRPRRDEMSDGEFVARVAEEADCGILLDLHNVWANARNGRQSVEAFLEDLPLERVWEVHLAGGFEREGYWLDSHSGEIPDELVAIAFDTVTRLPNLRAILFEIFPTYVSRLGTVGLRRQLLVLRSLWERRGRNVSKPNRKKAVTVRAKAHPAPSAREWEDALGALVVGAEGRGALAEELARDPGVSVMRELLEDFRSSMISRTLTLTSRLILATAGPGFLRSLLEGYWRKNPPKPFASQEALGFAHHLRGLCLEVPFLSEILDYEMAVLAAILDGRNRVIAFRHDPLVLLRSLAKGRLPEAPARGNFEIEITGAA